MRCFSRAEKLRKDNKSLRMYSNLLGLDTVKRYRYWYRYCFKEYHMLPFHSLDVLLTILTTVKLPYIRYLNMIFHNKIS